MPFIFSEITRWIKQDTGATAVEYGLLLAGVALFVSVAVFALGDGIVAVFQDIAAFLSP